MQLSVAIGVTNAECRETALEIGRATAERQAERIAPPTFTAFVTTESSKKEMPAEPDSREPKYLKDVDHCTN